MKLGSVATNRGSDSATILWQSQNEFQPLLFPNYNPMIVYLLWEKYQPRVIMERGLMPEVLTRIPEVSSGTKHFPSEVKGIMQTWSQETWNKIWTSCPQEVGLKKSTEFKEERGFQLLCMVLGEPADFPVALRHHTGRLVPPWLWDLEP